MSSGLYLMQCLWEIPSSPIGEGKSSPFIESLFCVSDLVFANSFHFFCPFFFQTNPETDFHCITTFGSNFTQDIPLPAVSYILLPFFFILSDHQITLTFWNISGNNDWFSTNSWWKINYQKWVGIALKYYIWFMLIIHLSWLNHDGNLSTMYTAWKDPRTLPRFPILFTSLFCMLLMLYFPVECFVCLEFCMKFCSWR